MVKRFIPSSIRSLRHHRAALLLRRFPFFSGLFGVLCGTAMVRLLGGGSAHHPHHALLAEQQCPEWDLTAAVQKQAQSNYCVRHFTGRPPRPDVVNARLHLPAAGAAQYPFFVYEAGDYVSGSIRGSGHWEPEIAAALVEALTRVAEAKGLPREQVHLLDVGGNVGSHTVYVQAAGFCVVAFEPLLPNEDIIRSNLCVADPEQRRVIFFNKGLGAEKDVCTFYSNSANQGDGVLYCGGERPSNDAYLSRGRVEVGRLDDILLPCRGGTRLPPGMVFGAMKMDVESFEPRVVEGGRKFLAAARIPFVVFEINRLMAEERRSVLQVFYDLGYQASGQGFFEGEFGQPEDLTGVDNAFMVLPLEGGEGERRRRHQGKRRE